MPPDHSKARTVALFDDAPPDPEQLKVKVVSLFTETFVLPPPGFTPPTPLLIEQVVAFWQAHDRVELRGGGITIRLGFAEKVQAGGDGKQSLLTKHPFAPGPFTITHDRFWHTRCVGFGVQFAFVMHSFDPGPGIVTQLKF